MSLAECRLRAALETHVLRPWFGRCIDVTHGGFRSEFDRDWRDVGTPVRLLEFQARQTRVAALASRELPEQTVYRDACLHGFRYLHDVLWDALAGGWFMAVDPSGEPLGDGAKHAHGIAYAIQSCLEVADALDFEPARDLAVAGFRWLDAHAWDESHGGYWGPMSRDGKPIRSPAVAPHPAKHDHIGTPYGAKDVNVAGDMLETLSQLVSLPGQSLAQGRLAFLLESLEQRADDYGHLPTYFDRRGAALSGVYHPGYQLQATYRLWRARRCLGLPAEPSERLGVRLYDAALRCSDPAGGLLSPGGDEEWWPQFERLRAAAHLGTVLAGGERVGFRHEAAATWLRLWTLYFDHDRAGTLPSPAPAGLDQPKGSIWKDASHECATLIELRRFASTWT